MTGLRQKAGPEFAADDVLTELASVLSRQWHTEARVLRIFDPEPLPVRWSSSERTTSGTDGVRGLAGLLRAGPEQRLMILGGQGAGRSVAALLLTLELLRGRAPGDPLPVLLGAEMWDVPRSPADFLIHRLAADYAAVLYRHGEPLDVARRLVEQHRILPVLDGVDELPNPGELVLHGDPSALGQSVVLTFPSGTYHEIVTEIGRPDGWTVVELAPPSPDDVAAFLAGAVPSSDLRWQPLLDAARSDPAGRAATVLAKPSNVQLVRSIYARPDSAPTELLDGARFPAPAAIEDYLLDTFLANAVALDAPGDRPDPAVRWLSSMAASLDAAGANHIGLPDLTTMASETVYLAAAVVVGLVAEASVTPIHGWLGLMAALSAGLFCGVAGVLPAAARAVGWGGRLFGGRPRPEAVGVAAFIGVICVLVGLFAADSAERPAVVVIGLSLLVPTFVAGVPLVTRYDLGLRESALADRRYSTFRAMIGGLVASAAALVTLGWPSAIAMAVVGAVVGVSGTASYRLYVSRVWLAVRGEGPIRLLAFLDDAHQAGVLRRRGEIYQFRDSALRERLVALHGPAGAVRPSEHSPASIAIIQLRAALVDTAFERASVRTLVGPDRVDRLRDEIGAELRGGSDRVAAATGAQWDRLAGAKATYLEKMAVPGLARAAGAYGWVAGCLAALLLAIAVLWDARGWLPLAVAGLMIVAGLVLGALSMLERLRVAIASHAPEVAWPGRSRWGERLLGIRIFPEHWWRWARPAIRTLIALGVAGLAVQGPRFWSGAEGPTPAFVVVLGAATAVSVVLWYWSRPWRARLRAFREVDKAAWPAAKETPWAGAARRAAVRAWDEWATAVVDLGVLPLLGAKIEPLTRRNYETALPAVSVERLGDITEGVQFVSTAESDRLSRMIAATLSAAIGISGPRGVGKTTLLRRFGDQRIGSGTDNLMLVVSAPTNYDSRDFLVHLFARLCEAVLPPGEPARGRRRIRTWWPWASAIAGVAVVAAAGWWERAAGIPSWLENHVRAAVLAAGVVLLLVPAVRAAAAMVVRRRRPQDTTVVDEARQHLRRLRYLETRTVTRSGSLKAPSTVEVGGSTARARAEQARTYPQLVADFREFLGLVGLHLRSRPGRPYARVVICIDELDKISSAEQAEQFLNDVKTVFGVDGCVFLVAVSEDALAGFARRALSTRTAFDTAFDDIITLRRFELADTRRLLVQRVLRLPEPYVWLCHVLSGGLPRDLNRTVRVLYDVRGHRGFSDFAKLAAELVRQDVESVAHGQALELTDRSDPATAAVARWLDGARRLTLTAASVRAYAADAPAQEDPPKAMLVEQFQAYLEYVAAVLDHFCERTAETIARLRHVDEDAANPARHLAEARAALSADPVAARTSVADFLREMADG